jgi:hypothetical protein
MKICVTCSRLPGEDAPSAFYVGSHRLTVTAVLDRWTDGAHRYFDVCVDDRRRFILRFDSAIRVWELAAVFAASARRPAPKKAVIPTAPRKFFAPLEPASPK